MEHTHVNRKRSNSGLSIKGLLLSMAAIAMVAGILTPIVHKVRKLATEMQKDNLAEEYVTTYGTDANAPALEMAADPNQTGVYVLLSGDVALSNDPNAAFTEETQEFERELLTTGLLEFRDSEQQNKEEPLAVDVVTADAVSDAEQIEVQPSVEYELECAVETSEAEAADSEAEPQAGLVKRICGYVKGFPACTYSKIQTSDRSQVALVVVPAAVLGLGLVRRRKRRRLITDSRKSFSRAANSHRGFSNAEWFVIGLVIVAMVFAIAKPAATKSLALETSRKIQENLPSFLATLVFLCLFAVLKRQSTRMKGISANQKTLISSFGKIATMIKVPDTSTGVSSGPERAAQSTEALSPSANLMGPLQQQLDRMEGYLGLIMPNEDDIRRILMCALQTNNVRDLEALKAAGKLTPETTSNLDDKKNTAYHIATKSGSAEAARFLSDNNLASKAAENTDGKTPENLMLEYLGVVVVNKNVKPNKKVKPFADFWREGLLTNDNIDKEVAGGLNGGYLVDAAAHNGSWDVVIWIWSNTDANLESSTIDGKSPMQWIRERLADVIKDEDDDTKPFKKILESNILGTDDRINQSADDDDNTLYGLAVKHGAIKIAALLEENDASVDETNKYSETPEDLMLNRLAEVASDGSDDVTLFTKFLKVDLLNDDNITKEVPDISKTLAETALENGSVKIALLLKENDGFAQPGDEPFIDPVVSSLSSDTVDKKTERLIKFLKAGLLNEDNINSPVDDSGETLAFVAAESGALDVAALLFKYGARFDTPNIGGTTPQSMLMKPLVPAVQADDIETARSCLQIGNLHRKLSDPLDVYNNTLLHTAFNGCDSVNVAALLIEYGANIDAKNRSNETPRSLRNARLVIAAKAGHMTMLEMYLKSGLFRVNDPVDDQGRNVLDITLESDNTRTASQLVIKFSARPRRVSIQSRIKNAINNDNPALLQKYLDANLFSLNERPDSDNENTAAHIAVKGKKKRVVVWLQQQCANFDIQNYRGETANQLMLDEWTES